LKDRCGTNREDPQLYDRQFSPGLIKALFPTSNWYITPSSKSFGNDCDGEEKDDDEEEDNEDDNDHN